MRTLYTLFLFALAVSCNKEEMQKNAVINAMTIGQWKVVSFTNGGTDVTADFLVYKFQFRENFTVDAIDNTATIKSGSWTADPNARTISSSFENANSTLSLLNGTWQITNSSWTFVEASLTVNGELRTLRLEKI